MAFNFSEVTFPTSVDVKSELQNFTLKCEGIMKASVLFPQSSCYYFPLYSPVYFKPFLKDYFWDKKRCIIVQCSFYSLFFTQLHFKSFYQQPTVVSVPVNIPLDFKSFYFLKSFLYLFVNEHWLGSLQGKTSTSMISHWGIIITALAGILLALVSITVGLSVAVSYLKTLNQTQSSSLHFCRGNQKRAR